MKKCNFHFCKNWFFELYFPYTDSVYFSFFIFKKELKNELLKQIKINLMIIMTSMFYKLSKSKFVSSPLRFSAVQWSRGHKESAV